MLSLVILTAFDLAFSGTSTNVRLILTVSINNIPKPFRSSEWLLCLDNLSLLEIHKLYSVVDFLIFPSFLESLGLPLLEAKLYNLPIICSDLDYVYQVCSPLSTFNPLSSFDIANSISEVIYRK